MDTPPEGAIGRACITVARIAGLALAAGIAACAGPRGEPPEGSVDTALPSTPVPGLEPLPDIPLELCINELWPAGARTAADRVELFNPGTAPVDLTGWKLTDDPDTLGAGQILEGGTVAPGEARVVDLVSFALDADGEKLGLFAPDGRGSVVDWDEPVPVDVSLARRTDCCTGPDCWTWAWLGSPGTSNGVLWRDRGDPWTDAADTPEGRLFTHELSVDDPAAIEALTVEVSPVGGGFVASWNGVEVARVGVSSSELVPLQAAPRATTRLTLDPAAVVAGPNVLELHAIGAGATLDAVVHARGALPPVPAPPQPSGVVAEEEVVPPDLADALFSTDRVHRIEVSLSAAALDTLEVSEPGVYVEGDAVVDGMFFGSVGVRRRGKLGSLRPMSGKPKLRLDLNRYLPGGELGGLQALQLNNAVQDCAFVREPMGYAVFAAAGRPRPRETWARLLVNGEDRGQYYLLEDIDDRYLQRWFDDPSGTLYDGSYVEENGNPLALTDFTADRVHRFDQESGPDLGGADLLAVQIALDQWAAGTLSYGDVGLYLDWPAWHRHLATEEWVGHTDGYLLMPNNYWVYFDPTTGLATPLTWDTDQVFLHDWQWFTTTWHDPDGRIAALCFADADCTAAHTLEVVDLLATLDPAVLLATLDDHEAVSLQGTLDDPLRECAESTLYDQRADVRAWLEVRSDEVRAAWGL